MRYLLILALLSAQLLIGQSSQDFLKTSPYLADDTPAWAVEMYKANPNVLKVDELYATYHQDMPFQKTIHTQNYKHWRRAIEPYIVETGFLSIPDVKATAKAKEQILAKKRGANRSLNAWVPMGPFETYTTGANQMPVSWQANVYTLDQSVTEPNTLYAGTESGGIFKTVDKGVCLLYTSPSPRDLSTSRMPSSA